MSDPSPASLTEIAILRRLESTDRELRTLEEDRSEAMKGFSEARKAIEKVRNSLLNQLDGHRRGEQPLFTEESTEEVDR